MGRTHRYQCDIWIGIFRNALSVLRLKSTVSLARALERVYEECFCWLLVQKGLSITRQHHVPITFQGLTFPAAFRLDVIVEDRLVVEVKRVEQLLRLHQSQLLTYLKMANKQFGLLINFNTSPLKDGIKRVIAP